MQALTAGFAAGIEWEHLYPFAGSSAAAAALRSDRKARDPSAACGWDWSPADEVLGLSELAADAQALYGAQFVEAGRRDRTNDLLRSARLLFPACLCLHAKLCLAPDSV